MMVSGLTVCVTYNTDTVYARLVSNTISGSRLALTLTVTYYPNTLILTPILTLT